MEAFLRVVRDIALLIARIVTGVILVAHGWYRWQITGVDLQVVVLEGSAFPLRRALPSPPSSSRWSEAPCSSSASRPRWSGLVWR